MFRQALGKQLETLESVDESSFDAAIRQAAEKSRSRKNTLNQQELTASDEYMLTVASELDKPKVTRIIVNIRF